MRLFATASALICIFAANASASFHSSRHSARAVARIDSVAGIITDSSGTPIAGARVAVTELGVAVTTGADGRFQFATSPGATLTLVVRRLGYAPASRIVTSTSGGVTIRMTPVGVPLEPVSVTATRASSSTLNSPLPTGELSGDQLRRDQSVSLAHAVARLPGVRALTTGGQIGKPVIRGVSGARVLTLDNGSRLEDYSWSDEDGPAVDARLLQRIEVIRGPASLLYGSDAIGGVINAIPLDLPDARNRANFHTTGAELSVASNNMESSAALRAEGAHNGIGWRGFAVGRFAEDLKSPEGKLENTGFEAFNAEVAVGTRSAKGSVALRVVHQGGEFKLLEAGGPPPGVEEEEGGPERKLMDDRVQLVANRFVGTSRLETKVQFQRHNIAELSDDISSPGAPMTETEVFNLLLNTLSSDVMLHHTVGNRVQGTIGASGLYQNNDSRGKIAVVPDARITGAALFLFEQLNAGPVSFVAGGRGDTRHLSADANSQLTMADETRSWNAASGDVGLIMRPTSNFALAGNLGRAWRAPTVFELFADGPRLGEARYEIGDADLLTEKGTNIDASARWESHRMRAEIAGFRQQIDNYVFLAPTGEPDVNSLPVYRYRQTQGLLTGGEIAAEIRPVDLITFRGKHDFVRGNDEGRKQPLPLVPPPRTAVEIEIENESIAALGAAHVGMEVEHFARQTRLSEFDTPTDAYTLLNLDAGATRRFRSRDVRFDVLVRNLGDVKYRSYLSRYKTFAYDPGRNIVLRVSTGM